jgi:hypothetical protein
VDKSEDRRGGVDLAAGQGERLEVTVLRLPRDGHRPSLRQPGAKILGSGRCKFPAGPGWKIAQRRYCRGTSIEIIGVSIAENGNITDLWFKWWYNLTLDHVYRYVPNIGMTHAWPQ